MQPHESETHSLSSFLADHQSHLNRLTSSGRPEVLTVAGEARLVIQDAQAYRALIDLIDEAQARSILADRINSIESGTPGIEASTVLHEVRQALGIMQDSNT